MGNKHSTHRRGDIISNDEFFAVMNALDAVEQDDIPPVQEIIIPCQVEVCNNTMEGVGVNLWDTSDETEIPAIMRQKWQMIENYPEMDPVMIHRQMKMYGAY